MTNAERVEKIRRRVGEEDSGTGVTGHDDIDCDDMDFLLAHIDTLTAQRDKIAEAAKPFLDVPAIRKYKKKQGFDFIIHDDWRRPPNITAGDFIALAQAVEKART